MDTTEHAVAGRELAGDQQEPTLHRWDAAGGYDGDHPFASYLNVSQNERTLSGIAGSLLTLVGLKRRDLPGLLVAGVGGALLYRGITGHCHLYERLGYDTASEEQKQSTSLGAHVSQTFLVDKPAEELYAWWRDFENLPQIMSHLESVRVEDDRRSHWVAKAPSIAGGSVEWDAEITADEPNKRIAWRSLPGAEVENTGQIEFSPALGDRGTVVHVTVDYLPPAGRVGKWVAKLFREEPSQQIRDDLRKFKRLMEVGEVLGTEGQPTGSCASLLHR